MGEVEAAGERSALAKGGMAELVELGPLLRIGEHRVRFGQLLELLLGRLVARVPVGMVLERQLAIGLFDLVLAGVAAQAEDFIVVPFVQW